MDELGEGLQWLWGSRPSIPYGASVALLVGGSGHSQDLSFLRQHLLLAPPLLEVSPRDG